MASVSSNGKFKVVKAHDVTDSPFFEQAVHMLNDEWARSAGARRMFLEQSCDALPCSLLLLMMDEEKKDDENAVVVVVAHARLCRVAGDVTAGYCESVVVSKNLRGQGIGREIMKHIELLGKSVQMKKIFLKTFDQEQFYSRLGYSKTNNAVTKLGKSALQTQALESLSSSNNRDNNAENKDKTTTIVNNNNNNGIEASISNPSSLSTPSLPPPPPPPPRPPTKTTAASSFSSSSSSSSKSFSLAEIWMEKSIE